MMSTLGKARRGADNDSQNQGGPWRALVSLGGPGGPWWALEGLGGPGAPSTTRRGLPQPPWEGFVPTSWQLGLVRQYPGNATHRGFSAQR